MCENWEYEYGLLILTVITGRNGPKISSVMISASSGGSNKIVGSINLTNLKVTDYFNCKLVHLFLLCVSFYGCLCASLDWWWIDRIMLCYCDFSKFHTFNLQQNHNITVISSNSRGKRKLVDRDYRRRVRDYPYRFASSTEPPWTIEAATRGSLRRLHNLWKCCLFTILESTFDSTMLSP